MGDNEKMDDVLKRMLNTPPKKEKNKDQDKASDAKKKPADRQDEK